MIRRITIDDEPTLKTYDKLEDFTINTLEDVVSYMSNALDFWIELDVDDEAKTVTVICQSDKEHEEFEAPTFRCATISLDQPYGVERACLTIMAMFQPDMTSRWIERVCEHEDARSSILIGLGWHCTMTKPEFIFDRFDLWRNPTNGCIEVDPNKPWNPEKFKSPLCKFA